MFEIHPVDAAKTALLAQIEGINGPVSAMIVWNDGREAGHILYRLERDTVDLLACCCTDAELAQWLVRAALNAAANRDAINAVCCNTALFPLLRSLAFEEEGERLTVFIPAFFNRPCGGCESSC